MRTLLSFIALFGFTTAKLGNALIDLRPMAKKIDVKKLRCGLLATGPEKMSGAVAINPAQAHACVLGVTAPSIQTSFRCGAKSAF